MNDGILTVHLPSRRYASPYRPHRYLFAEHLQRFLIKPEVFRQSLCARGIKGGLIGSDGGGGGDGSDGDLEEGGGGASGALFFYSRDHKFVLKSLSQYEFDLLR